MIRLALVGAGVHGRQHAEAIRALRRAGRDVRIEFVIDTSEERAAAFAASVAAECSGGPELLAQLTGEDVEGVAVCTPTETHLAVAETCANLLLPTLIEKPLAPTLADADRIIATFEARGVALFAGHSTRFDPASRQLQRAIASGALGGLGLIAIHQYQGYAWAGGWRAWQLDDRRSGGRIVHLGIHDIDLACWLAGAEPVALRATARPTTGGAWAAYTLQVTFANEAVAIVTAEWCVTPADMLRKVMLAVGSEGRARYDSAHDEVAAMPTGPPDRSVGYDEATRAQLMHWLDCLEGRAEPLVSPREARTALSVAFGAEDSARHDGRVVTFAESDDA